MKRFLKRVVLWVLAASLGLCCAGFAEVATESVDTRMLSDVVNFAYQEELAFGAALWAISYIEQFQQQRTWDNLQIARAAVSIARIQIQNCGLGEMDFTDQDAMTLLEQEKDATWVPVLKEQFEETKSQLLHTCVNLQTYLLDYMYYAEESMTVFEQVGFNKALADLYLQFNALQADYAVTQAQDKGAIDKFESAFSTYCPLTAAYRDASADAESLALKAADILDQIAEIENQEAQVTGKLQALHDHFVTSLESQDFSWFEEQRIEIEGMPVAIAYPAWFDTTETWIYYWKDGDKVEAMPVPWDELTRSPEGCIISKDGVTKEEVTAYQQELEELGLPADSISDTDEGLRIEYTFGEGSLCLQWQDGKTDVTMFKCPLCFVPLWYFLADI